MKIKKLTSILAVVLSLTLILSGCAPKPTATETAKPAEKTTAAKSDTFIYGIDGDPGNAVNVITTGDRYGLMTVKTIYSPLYMYNGADKINYFLADSITPAKDFKSYTVQLKKNVKWHDGQPFTADDVVFTYEQMLKESNGGWARGQLIFNGQPVKVEKLDDYSVKFTLASVSMSAIESLGNIFIMPKHIYAGEANIENSPKNATPVGTGPYKLKEYKAGEYVKFEKNDNYFLGAPKIANVVYRIIGDANTAGLALQNGEINALAITAQDVEKYKADKKLSIVPYEEGRVGYMAFNMSSKTVQNKELRQALIYAINRVEINKASFISEEYSNPAYTFLPRKATFYTENVDKHDFDVTKSKTLLAKSKVTGLKLKLAYIANNKVQEKQAVIIQQELKAVGVDIQLVGMEAKALYNKLATVHSDFDLFLNGYIMGIDPDTFNGLFVTGDPNNYMHYSNPKVDKLFKEGRVETDATKRKAIYEEIQKTVIDDAAYYPISENKRILAIDANVAGIEEAGLVPVYTFEDMSKLYFK